MGNNSSSKRGKKNAPFLQSNMDESQKNVRAQSQSPSTEDEGGWILECMVEFVKSPEYKEYLRNAGHDQDYVDKRMDHFLNQPRQGRQNFAGDGLAYDSNGKKMKKQQQAEQQEREEEKSSGDIVIRISELR